MLSLGQKRETIVRSGPLTSDGADGATRGADAVGELYVEVERARPRPHRPAVPHEGDDPLRRPIAYDGQWYVRITQPELHGARGVNRGVERSTRAGIPHNPLSAEA